MVKLTFFVHCASWKDGGYKNVHYFTTEKEAEEWAKENHVDIIDMKTVSKGEFAEDYMGDY